MAVGFTRTNSEAEPSILEPFRIVFDVLGPTWVQDPDRRIRIDLLCLYMFTRAPGTLWVSKSRHFCGIQQKVITFLRLTQTAKLVIGTYLPIGPIGWLSPANAEQ